jgi:hypothetical protein
MEGWLAGDLWPSILGGTLVVGLIVGFWAFATGVTPDIWVPVVIYLGLHLVSIPICLLLTRRPADRPLRKVLLLALVVKLACVFPRYAVNEYLYGGESDAGQYLNAGQVFYDNVHHGSWSIDPSFISNYSDETRMVGYLTGVVFLVTGTTFMGGYMTFTWIAWLGCLFVLQAFRCAFPNAPPVRAAILIFFLPSLLYWPSSLGKDSVMLFSLGLLTLGIARLVAPNRALLGAVWAAIGAYLVTMVRPHLLAIALMGVAVAALTRNAANQRTRTAVGVRLLLLALLVPGLFLALNRVDQTFGARDTGKASVSQVFEDTKRKTSIGGSSFETSSVRSPLDVPQATFSVIYRPFLFEASNFPMFVSAAEGSALLCLTVLSARWIWRMGPAMVHNPFAAYCGAYVVAFVIAFSNIANAGILARQRVQMFPMLMMLVAAAYEHHRLATAAGTDPGPTPATTSSTPADTAPSRALPTLTAC